MQHTAYPEQHSEIKKYNMKKIPEGAGNNMTMQARLAVYLKAKKDEAARTGNTEQVLDHTSRSDSGDVTSCDMDSGSDDSDDCIDEDDDNYL